jgi:hypothetical protein
MTTNTNTNTPRKATLIGATIGCYTFVPSTGNSASSWLEAIASDWHRDRTGASCDAIAIGTMVEVYCTDTLDILATYNAEELGWTRSPVYLARLAAA